uniref:Gty37 protein n=1 Tax=Gerbera hybrida TaxID=18101 RepID=Q65A67_GERHY|nr:Gty37 protein [Gerbera hybrid cultivar]
MILNTVSGRDIPKTNLKKRDDVKHPDMFFMHDRGYLVPGIGRGIKPKCKDGFNPFTYNPVTGGNNGIPVTFPGVGGSVGGGNVGGGDDTFGPTPGVEGPFPGSSGGGNVGGGDDTFGPTPGVEGPFPGSSGGADGPSSP